jgi:hypothetical protein
VELAFLQVLFICSFHLRSSAISSPKWGFDGTCLALEKSRIPMSTCETSREAQRLNITKPWVQVGLLLRNATCSYHT